MSRIKQQTKGIMSQTQTAVRSDVVVSLGAILEKSSVENKVHWTTFFDHWVKTNLCTNDELVSAMNSLLLPQGNISGANHYFWKGFPE